MTAGPTITEERITVEGVEVHLRRTDGEGDPVLFSHGNPTHSGDWVDFMRALGRPSIAIDHPGFGRSERPRGFDYSFRNLGRFFGACRRALGIERHALVVHDWGGVALLDAIEHPEEVERLVVIDAVPLLPGYRWHWIARYFWRVPVVGEVFNVLTTKAALRLISRQSNARPGPLPEEFIEMVWRGWRPRTVNRPILDLYRSGDPDALAAAGVGLGNLECPALVVWGRRDPYIPARFGPAYAERLPDARLIELPDAGHWPWLDRPDVVETVARFLSD